ncbi:MULTISPECIES: ABC transporter permease [Oceanotoga]|uniref:ABC transporter permease n=1 Tax=Oceanotoga TaxID=1255275 RepID=UPI0026521D13|nr:MULTISPECIES: ABC transporter permease subunit [Oceanotoga]MDN5343494.1 NitT/TauT family transport system permease protein [Oceanotoga sp.]MDO7975760.1 ABC transporter permease subunit [Oceanotoga teriensis]
MKYIKKNIFKILYATFIILGLWYLLSFIINKPIIPYPHKVIIYIFSKNIIDIFIHINYSLFRIVTGILFALIIGYPLGILMGFYDRIDKILSPIVYLTYPVPKIALLPIIMLLFGLGNLSKILMIVLIIIFQIILASRDGVKSIENGIYDTFISLGAKKIDFFTDIVFPATISKVLTALRIAVGTTISVLFFTETFGTEHGMGYYIMDSWMRYNYIEMYSGIVILSFLGLFLFILLDFFEFLLCPWNK